MTDTTNIENNVNYYDTAPVNQPVAQARKKLNLRLIFTEIDKPFFVLVMVLVVFGLVMMFSASYGWGLADTGDGTYYLKRQAFAGGIGIAAMLLLSVFDELSEAAEDRMRDCSDRSASAVKVLKLDATGMWGAAEYSSDRRTLMSLNRSNGGATLLSDGMIIAKWPNRSLPSGDSLSELLAQEPAEAMMQQNTPKRLKFQGFLLYVAAVLLLL